MSGVLFSRGNPGGLTEWALLAFAGKPYPLMFKFAVRRMSQAVIARVAAALIFVVINLVFDLLSLVFDPRLRVRSVGGHG